MSNDQFRPISIFSISLGAFGAVLATGEFIYHAIRVYQHPTAQVPVAMTFAGITIVVVAGSLIILLALLRFGEALLCRLSARTTRLGRGASNDPDG